MGHFFSKVSLFIDKKEAAAHLILDQDFATAPFLHGCYYLLSPLPIGPLRNPPCCFFVVSETALLGTVYPFI